MAAELKQRYGVDAELKPSHGGVFEVEVDGKNLFSKKLLHRFPNSGEVEGLIEAGT